LPLSLALPLRERALTEFQLVTYKLIAKEFALSEFEKLIYSYSELESILDSEDYIELISLNYKTPSSLYEAEKLLTKYVDVGKYYEWYVEQILMKIIERPKNVQKYIEQCYDLYCDGFGFLDNLGIGYGLCLTVPPENYKADSWAELTSPEQKTLIESFYPDVAVEAKKVLSWFELGKIILKGHDGTNQGIEYEDNRTSKEKEPSGYQVTST
jgi:hypothetical protein